MVEKIISYYRQGPQKKYFLLKVAVSTRKNERQLIYAIAISTNKKIEDLKEYIYDEFEYKEFLLESKRFLDLISKKQKIIEIEGFKIPFLETPNVDDYFIPTIEDEFNIGMPYKLFMIRVGNQVYAYGPLSHPDYPNYSSFYPFIKEHIGLDMIPGKLADFCVVFPIEKAYLSNFRVKRNKITFDVNGNLEGVYYTYYLKSEKEEKKNKVKAKRKNAIKFKGKIIEFELNLWYYKEKLDYFRTRNIDSKKLSQNSYWHKSESISEQKSTSTKKGSIFKKFIMNPWVIGIGAAVIGGQYYML